MRGCHAHHTVLRLLDTVPAAILAELFLAKPHGLSSNVIAHDGRHEVGRGVVSNPQMEVILHGPRAELFNTGVSISAGMGPPVAMTRFMNHQSHEPLQLSEILRGCRGWQPAKHGVADIDCIWRIAAETGLNISSKSYATDCFNQPA